MSASFRFCVFAALMLIPTLAGSTDYGPMTHGGGDFVLMDGDRVWGRHDGIRAFTIATSATVLVAPYDGGTSPGVGLLDVEASTVDVGGTITAMGAGYTGGGGGGGGGASVTTMKASCSSPAGSGGSGDYGTSFTGVAGPPPSGGAGVGAPGGAGAPGDGPFAGDPAALIDGGYAALGANGDTTLDASLLMGSGGAGGTGTPGSSFLNLSDPLNPVATCYSGMGGGAGGRGGGIIRLKATQDFVLRSGARIEAGGAFGSDTAVKPEGGRNVSPAGTGNPGVPYPGGRGAGGGILIDVSAAAQALFETGVISSLGAGGNPGNGGTVKVFYNPAAWRQNHAVVQSGRFFQTPESAAVSTGWELYD